MQLPLSLAARALSNVVGLPDDQARFVVCILATYPLGLMFSQIIPAQKDKSSLRHFLSGALGVYIAWEFMAWGILHAVISSSIAYTLLRILPRMVQHKVIFAFAMLYLCGVHIYRMYTGYLSYVVDFSGPQMMVTIKLITLAFDYRDGNLKDDNKNTALAIHQREMKLTQAPSILEFFGYMFSFCGLLAGPAVNFAEYRNWIDGSVFASAPGKRLPNPIVPGLSKLLVAVICAGTMQFTAAQMPILYTTEPAFLEHSFFYRVVYLWISCGLCRVSYYFAWNFSEGACIWAGLGYKGWKNGSPDFTRATNVHITRIETAQNFHAVTSNWNVRTNDWLKYYVAMRVPRAYSVHITMLTSATWHGFYPGYFLSFFTSGFCIEGARLLRKRVRTLFVSYKEVITGTATTYKEVPKSTKPIYDVICVFVTSIALNYCMVPFQVLGWERALHAWSGVYWWFHIVIIVGLGLLSLRLPIWGRGPPAPPVSSHPRSNSKTKRA